MRRLALFDFDGTMMKGDSISKLVNLMLRRKIMTLSHGLRLLWVMLLWKLGMQRVEEVKRLALSPLARLPEADRDALLRRFVLNELAPRLYPGALEALRGHAAQGYLVLLVSASPALYIRYMAGVLPVDAAIGTEMGVDFTVCENMTGGAKVRAVHRYLEQNGIGADWAASYAYGDSRSDLPMLRLVGNPYLVNAKSGTSREQPGIPKLTWR